MGSKIAHREKFTGLISCLSATSISVFTLDMVTKLLWSKDNQLTLDALEHDVLTRLGFFLNRVKLLGLTVDLVFRVAVSREADLLGRNRFALARLLEDRKRRHVEECSCNGVGTDETTLEKGSRELIYSMLKTRAQRLITLTGTLLE